MKIALLALAIQLTASFPAMAEPQPVSIPTKDAARSWWSEMRSVADLVRTEKGIESMFYTFPQLASRFATFDHFKDYYKKWSNRIPPIPEKELNSPKAGITWEQKVHDNGQTVYLTFQNQENPGLLTIMRISWENDKISDLFFMKAIQGGVGQETYKFQDRYYDPSLYYNRQRSGR